MIDLASLRETIRLQLYADEQLVLQELVSKATLSGETHTAIQSRAIRLIEAIRADDEPGLMEVFLAEYGLSTDAGVALMCLAEALLRVPDPTTMDELIEDKIAPSSWGTHLGKSSSSLVNASTWALLLTGRVLDDEGSMGVQKILHNAVRRLGEPVIRTAVRRAMKEMGNQFVLGESIDSALKRASKLEAEGYTYSYDMLGEAALTDSDANDFFVSYAQSIQALSKLCKPDRSPRENPGISVKLSALHPRYEVSQRERVLSELVPRTLELALLAKEAGMGFNIDAEEADRLDLSLDVIEQVLCNPRLAGWEGFGVVVQAYGKRASSVIEWLHALAVNHDRRIMERLVKGAYWDTEIKHAQVEGLPGFSVFTQKHNTDVSYICCAKLLLSLSPRIYPQFATHNAHTVAAVLELCDDSDSFEFQRLHGMGESLHRQVLNSEKTRCRIYAPVGEHVDLLAYLVRRLLENGANSSFVNQIVDTTLAASDIAVNPFEHCSLNTAAESVAFSQPQELYSPERGNSKGFDLGDEVTLRALYASRDAYRRTHWSAAPLMVESSNNQEQVEIYNPSNPDERVGQVVYASLRDVDSAFANAENWSSVNVAERAKVLVQASHLYEERYGEFFALLAREAGKTLMDAVAELREAVDFLRYYAAQSEALGDQDPRGVIVCISPWNFPLAIFTGQIAAALATGNSVIAKPAESTSLVAALAVELLHEAGVPKAALQLLPGLGVDIGARIVSDTRIGGVCFTGSTATAQSIHRSMAEHASPDASLIAETGGLNAMIIDSTALPQQAVDAIVASAFQSAGQRCSACRMLYVQSDVADTVLKMLIGAMEQLQVGEPWYHKSDVGPIISAEAQEHLVSYVEAMASAGAVIKRLSVPSVGYFVGPTLVRVNGIADLQEEMFGPVLHVATYEAHELDQVIDDINQRGYGLTFGLHTRIDDRVEAITTRIRAGNLYINRNQVGAVVGTQPFGGEGLSGTGPKAGGPDYLKSFVRPNPADKGEPATGDTIDGELVQAALNVAPPVSTRTISSMEMPGPTGESNKLSLFPRGLILCLGSSLASAREQADIARSAGCIALVVCPGATAEGELDGWLPRDMLSQLAGFSAVALWSTDDDLKAAKMALSRRNGEIIPLVTEQNLYERCLIERHVCIDTTASGGNASLLAQTS